MFIDLIEFGHDPGSAVHTEDSEERLAYEETLAPDPEGDALRAAERQALGIAEGQTILGIEELNRFARGAGRAALSPDSD